MTSAPETRCPQQWELCYVGKKQVFYSKIRLFIASRLTGLGQGQADPDRERSQGCREEDKAGTVLNLVQERQSPCSCSG